MWPQLAQTSNPDLPAYCLFFHVDHNIQGKTRNRGIIEYKLARMAKKLPQCAKKNATRVTIKKKTLAFAADHVSLVCNFSLMLSILSQISFFSGSCDIAIESGEQSANKETYRVYISEQMRNA
jgi:hypothetical protein